MFIQNSFKILAILGLMGLLIVTSCSKEKIAVESSDNVVANDENIESRSYYPLSLYTFALTSNTPSELYMIDPATGDNWGNHVRIHTPAGAVIPNVTGITLFQGVVVNGQHNEDTYYVSLGDNSATLADPIYSHHIWSVHIDVDVASGINQAVLSKMVVSTNGMTITDLCWSDFIYQNFGCGAVGLIEGRQDQMVYFDLYNNLTPTVIPINHGFLPTEYPDGLAWVYDPTPQCAVNSSIPFARLLLSTHVAAGATSKVNLYELEFGLQNGNLAVSPALIGFIDTDISPNPGGNGIGWLATHNAFFIGVDPNSTMSPPGSVRPEHLHYCNYVNLIQGGGNLTVPNRPIMQPIEDFMTILEFDPNQM
jgi:hypothetical protein